MSPSYVTKRSSEKLSHSPSTFVFRKAREDNDSFVALLMRSDLRNAIEDSLLGRNDELLRSVFLQILTAVQCRHTVSAVHREPTLETRSKSNVSLGTATSGPCNKSAAARSYLPRISEDDVEDSHRSPESYLRCTFPTISHHAITLLTRIVQPSMATSSLSLMRAEIMALDTFFAEPSNHDSDSEDDEQATDSDDQFLESYFTDEHQFVQVLEIPNQGFDVPITAARMEYMFELDSRSYASPVGARFDRDGVEGALSPWSAGFGAVWTYGSLSVSPSCDGPSSFPRPSIPWVPVDAAASFLDADEEIAIDEMLEDLYIS